MSFSSELSLELSPGQMIRIKMLFILSLPLSIDKQIVPFLPLVGGSRLAHNIGLVLNRQVFPHQLNLLLLPHLLCHLLLHSQTLSFGLQLIQLTYHFVHIHISKRTLLPSALHQLLKRYQIPSQHQLFEILLVNLAVAPSQIIRQFCMQQLLQVLLPPPIHHPTPNLQFLPYTTIALSHPLPQLLRRCIPLRKSIKKRKHYVNGQVTKLMQPLTLPKESIHQLLYYDIAKRTLPQSILILILKTDALIVNERRKNIVPNNHLQMPIVLSHIPQQIPKRKHSPVSQRVHKLFTVPLQHCLHPHPHRPSLSLVNRHRHVAAIGRFGPRLRKRKVSFGWRMVYGAKSLGVATNFHTIYLLITYRNQFINKYHSNRSRQTHPPQLTQHLLFPLRQLFYPLRVVTDRNRINQLLEVNHLTQRTRVRTPRQQIRLHQRQQLIHHLQTLLPTLSVDRPLLQRSHQPARKLQVQPSSQRVLEGQLGQQQEILLIVLRRNRPQLRKTSGPLKLPKIHHPQLLVVLLHLSQLRNRQVQTPRSQFHERLPLLGRHAQLLQPRQQLSHETTVVYQPLQHAVVATDALLRLLALHAQHVRITALVVLLVLLVLPFYRTTDAHHLLNTHEHLLRSNSPILVVAETAPDQLLQLKVLQVLEPDLVPEGMPQLLLVLHRPRRPSLHHLEHRHPQRPHVVLLRVLLLQQRLRTHVQRTPNLVLLLYRSLAPNRKPQIRQPHPPLVQQNVLRLNIPVNHPL